MSLMKPVKSSAGLRLSFPICRVGIIIVIISAACFTDEMRPNVYRVSNLFEEFRYKYGLYNF